jgi:hypothetical protein
VRQVPFTEGPNASFASKEMPPWHSMRKLLRYRRHLLSTQPLDFWIRQVDRDLALPEAQNPKTKLRLFEIRGQLENNYDATLAYNTWRRVEQLAAQQNDWVTRNRAYGEEAIGLFLLGDSASARIHVFMRSVAMSKPRTGFFRTARGRLRMASLIGSGMVEFKAYENALTYLNEAISISKSMPNAAYPNVAVSAKIDALRGLKRSNDTPKPSRFAPKRFAYRNGIT